MKEVEIERELVNLDVNRGDKPIYRVQDLSVSLGIGNAAHRVLESLTFELKRGECLSIVGPSGTGKTTLLRTLAGLVPYSGTVEFSGRVLDGPAKGVVLVFQDYTNALLRWRSVARNVSLGIEGTLDNDERQDRVDEALRIVGLEKYRDYYPWQLSGGMQQRVQIARALAIKPEVLLFDEPFGSLDAMTRAALQDELLSVRSIFETTCIFITHDIDEAVYLGNRVLVLAGSPATLKFELEVPLDEPRNQISTKESSEFLALRRLVYNDLKLAHDVGKSEN